MSLNSNLAHAIIEGNSINYGLSTTDGTSQSTWGYDAGITTNGDCKILNNNFAGINSSSNFINLTDGSSVISNNYFSRGSYSVNKYINVSSAYDQIIENNAFDSNSTGSSYSLVSSLSNTSIYLQNKNQIKSYAHYLSDPSGLNSNSSLITKINGPTPNTNATTSAYAYINITNSVGSIQSGYYYYTINLTELLPKNVKLLNVSMGLILTTGPFSYSSPSKFNFAVQKMMTNDVDYSNITTSFANSILDVNSYLLGDGMSGTAGTSNTITISNAGDEANFSASTKYLTADVSSNNFITGSDNDIVFTYQQITYLPASGSVQIAASPIVIHYTW